MIRAICRPCALLGALVLVFATVGCTSGDDGIFASVEREVKVNENNLSDEADGIGIQRYDPGAGTEYFVAAIGAGKLFARTTTGSSWSSMARPGEVQFLASLDGGSELYASTPSGLYLLSGQEPGVAQWGNPVMEANITGLVSVNENLLVTTEDANGTRTLHVNPQDDPTSVEITGITDDIAHASLFDDQVVVVGLRTGFYRFPVGMLTTGGVATTIIGPGSDASDPYYPRFVDGDTSDGDDSWVGKEFNGVAVVDDSDLGAGAWLVVSSLDGRVYAYDGSTWLRSSSTGDALAGMIAVDNGRALVGTISRTTPSSEYPNGYYEVILDSSVSPNTVSVVPPTTANYDAIVLEDVPVHRFVKSQADNTIFALTFGFGIWSIVDYTAASSVWAWE